MLRPTDAELMLRAIRLGERGLGHTRPNPAVGAVVVKDGQVLGEGWHRRAGGAHAEVAALQQAFHRVGQAAVRGATVYVTLEPCSRPGRVGACTEALIAAGVARVVYAVSDPNPKNGGRAARVLNAAGLSCIRFRGDSALLQRARQLVCGFRKHVLTGLPYVTVKLALSLDGCLCDQTGNANWISCAASRQRTNRLRERVDAIMVGAETVRRDNPSLLARQHPNADLLRVVISRSGQLPQTAQVFTDGRNPTLVFNDGVEALKELGRRGVMQVLCEGGLALARSLAEAGLVDEWLTITAPVVIGSQPLAAALRGWGWADASFVANGDAFFTAGLSEYATWAKKK